MWDYSWSMGQFFIFTGLSKDEEESIACPPTLSNSRMTKASSREGRENKNPKQTNVFICVDK